MVGAVTPVVEAALEASQPFTSGVSLTAYDGSGAVAVRVNPANAQVRAEAVSAGTSDGGPALEQITVAFGSLAVVAPTAAGAVSPAAGEQVLSYTAPPSRRPSTNSRWRRPTGS